MTIQIDVTPLSERRNFVAGSSFDVNWQDALHASVVASLGTASHQFVAFPAKYASGHVLNPNRLLEGCMLYPPAGYAVANPSTLVVLYDRQEDDRSHQSDVLADAGRRARSAIQSAGSQSVTTVANPTWESEQFSAVRIMLKSAATDTRVDFKFTKFPRPQEITPATIVPSTLLEDCRELKPSGFFVVNAKSLVVLYDRATASPESLTNAMERISMAIEKICGDVSRQYRVEKWTRKIVPINPL